MPAMSPFMVDGTITKWVKKEGDTFEVGDVLLQIVSPHFIALVHLQRLTTYLQESDIAVIDVQATHPGIRDRIHHGRREHLVKPLEAQLKVTCIGC